MGRIGYLQEQIRLNGRSDELVDEIKALGRKFGILSEYTSFLIVEEGVQREQVEAARQSFRRLEQAAADGTTGQMAVDRAKADSRMRGGWGMSAPAPGRMASESEAIATTYRKQGIEARNMDKYVRTRADKTFYYRRDDRTWYDSEFQKGTVIEPDTTVTLWSDAFFQLLRRHPSLRGYLLENERQMVQIDGKAILLIPPE
mgnify:CR=1 FL=1